MPELPATFRSREPSAVRANPWF